MKRFIAITDKQRDLITGAFGVTVRMVRYALTFERDTDLARRIRKLALQSGGVMMCVTKEIETIHDADGKMTQLMPNGAVIELDHSTGNATVYYKGEPRIGVENIRVREIASLQSAALKLR